MADKGQSKDDGKHYNKAQDDGSGTYDPSKTHKPGGAGAPKGKHHEGGRCDDKGGTKK